jgi:hypothetical protein
MVLATLALSAVFFATLLVQTLWLPQVMGRPLVVDWPSVITALVPVAILLVLILVTQSSSVSATIGGLKLQFVRGIPHSSTNTLSLTGSGIEKGSLDDLVFMVEQIRQRGETPRILTVRMRSRVDFMALREYVFQLSGVAPLRYVVFLADDERYLAYMEVDHFKEKYPRHAIELLLNDSSESSPLGQEYQQLLNGDHEELRRRVRTRILSLYWRPDDSAITESDLPRLGANKDKLVAPSATEAYIHLLRTNVAGVPVVNRRGQFVGIADRSGIEEEVVAYLVGERAPTNPSDVLEPAEASRRRAPQTSDDY